MGFCLFVCLGGGLFVRKKQFLNHTRAHKTPNQNGCEILSHCRTSVYSFSPRYWDFGERRRDAILHTPHSKLLCCWSGRGPGAGVPSLVEDVTRRTARLPHVKLADVILPLVPAAGRARAALAALCARTRKSTQGSSSRGTLRRCRSGTHQRNPPTVVFTSGAIIPK